jgi:hypothetical protein
MDKSTKTALIIMGVVLLLAAVTSMTILATGIWAFGRFVNWAEQSVSERPDIAVRVGSEIADYEVPKGFGSPYSIHFGEVSLVGYKSQDEESHILIAQFPEGTSINMEEMLRIISEGSNDPTSIWYNTKTTLIEDRPVIIRGQECTLNISEGTSSEGISYRSAAVTFEGKSGPSLVLMVSPREEWDIEMVEAFISSIQ